MSPVARTCVPPQSSVLKRPSPTETTRTLSPYFSPKSAMAPAAMASWVSRTAVVTGSFFRIASLTMPLDAAQVARRVTALKCTKSKRRRSGATSEPACFTCGPSTWRSAAVQQVGGGVVAARRVAQRDVDFGGDQVADARWRWRPARPGARAAARRRGATTPVTRERARPRSRSSPGRTPDRRPRRRTACVPSTDLAALAGRQRRRPAVFASSNSATTGTP